MSILRLIDANANRAREALRVLEDYARFVLDDAPSSTALKVIRHDLAQALSPVSADAIAWRDTPGDVGTTSKTHSEAIRADLPHVVIAAGKRLGEALRCLEEYLKIDHPASAATIEKCRYTAYDVEQRLSLTLRPTKRLANARLYVLLTASACRGDWLTIAREAITGGADVLQLREKELEGRELLLRAKQLVTLCRETGVISIINDRVDVALLSGADGVHLGQGDLPATEARKILGHRAIVGVSTHEIAHARQALRDGADYIGAGPTYLSPTKPRDINPGLPYLLELVSAEYPLPIFAIAGITQARAAEVAATGIRRVAVTSAVTQQDDVAGACRALKAALAPA